MHRIVGNKPSPVGRPYTRVLLLWPMCRDAQVSRFQDEKERQKSPKPSSPAPSPVNPTGSLIASVASAGPSKGPLTSMDGGNAKGLLGTILACPCGWTRDLQRFTFPAPACKSRVCLPWQTRSAGPSMRYAVPASLWHRPKPPVAWAFGGVKVHRTFTCYRLTHWTFAYIRFTPLAPLRAGLRLGRHSARRKAQKKPYFPPLTANG